jgi:hypothetical protein
MPVNRKPKTKAAVQPPEQADPRPSKDPKPRRGMLIRTATEEDYRKRAYDSIGTFYRAKDGKVIR